MPAVAGFFAGAFGWGVAGATATAWGGAWLAGAGFASTIVGGLAVKLLTSVAISALQLALAPSPSGGGLTISTTLRGEDNPETIILGRYATSGQCVYVNSHGKSNRYLTHVVELCSAPGATISRLALGDKWVTLGTTPHAEYGLPVLGDYEGHVWLRYYDGRQTAADPDLVAKYGTDTDRPWTSTAVGAGLCYAVMTFHYDQEDLPQVPSYRFEMDGVPLYDIRKDSTAGGSGSQRLADPATWAQTNNPIVMGWNILRGIPLPGGEIYGGGYDLSMLPPSVWMAAMNRCDAAVPIAGGGTEPAYRAGIEAAMTQEPAQPLTEIFKACSATVADMGYAWTITVGAPGLPVYAFNDDDVIVSKNQTLDPFPSLSETYNAVSARYPAPGKLWETREAPLRTNTSAEASDAFGRRTAALTLPAVPYGRQVQRLTAAWLADERRFIRHILNLPADSSAVELTDTVDWTSGRNGYSAKIFSVYEISEDVRTGIRQMSLRERDPADYGWTSAQELPAPPDATATPRAPEAVEGFAVSGVSITDSAGQARRPAIQISWDPELTGRGLRWQIRFAGQTTVRLHGDTQRLDDGVEVISAGVLPARNYEVRARLLKGRKTAWSGWLSVTTPSVYIGSEDVSDTFIDEIEGIAAMAGVTTVSSLPATGSKLNQIVMLVPPGRLYRWTGSAWSTQLYGGVEAGSLDIAAFAASIRPPEVMATLPTTGNVAGRQVYRTSDHTMWRYNGTAWVNTASTSLLVGKIVAGQIDVAAVGAQELAADAVTVRSLAVSNFSNLILNSELSNADGWTFTGGAAFLQTPPSNASAPGNFTTPTITSGEAMARWFSGASRRLPVRPGEEYFISADFRASGTTPSFRTRIVVWMYDRAGTYVGAYVGGIETLTTTAYTNKSLVWAVPAGVAYCEIGFGRTGDSGASGTGYIENPNVRRRHDGKLIVDGSVAAAHVEANAITAKHLLITDFTNLAGSSDMLDESYWVTGGGTMAYINGNPSWASERLLSLAAAAGTYGVANGQRISVEPEERFLASCNARIVSGSGSCFLQAQTSASADFSASTFVTISATTSTAVTKLEGQVNIPPGHRFLRLRLILGNDGATACYFGNVSLRRKTAGKLIVDGTVKASHVDTDSFSTNGIALFGGELKSSNFVQGSSGWRIRNTGEAELESLVVRTRHLEAGAVSADWNSYTSGWLPLSNGALLDVQTLTINDPTVAGCRAWVTYSCQIGMTRSTAGRGRGEFWMNLSDGAGAQSFGYWEINQYLPANVEMQLPISMTRRVLLTGGTATISINAGNLDCDTFRFRNRRIEVNVMKR